MDRLLAFVQRWDALAEQGLVDERGGMEYSRVLCEWERAGQPLGCLAFILQATGPGTVDWTDPKRPRGTVH